MPAKTKHPFSGAFYINGTEKILRDDKNNLVKEDTHKDLITVIKNGGNKKTYIYTPPDGNSFEIIKYHTANYHKSNAKTKKDLTLYYEDRDEQLLDNEGKAILLGDPRIRKQSFGEESERFKYFYRANESTPEIPVLSYHVKKMRKVRAKKSKLHELKEYANKLNDMKPTELVAEYNKKLQQSICTSEATSTNVTTVSSPEIDVFSNQDHTTSIASQSPVINKQPNISTTTNSSINFDDGLLNLFKIAKEIDESDQSNEVKRSDIDNLPNQSTYNPNRLFSPQSNKDVKCNSSNKRKESPEKTYQPSEKKKKI